MAQTTHKDQPDMSKSKLRVVHKSTTITAQPNPRGIPQRPSFYKAHIGVDHSPIFSQTKSLSPPPFCTVLFIAVISCTGRYAHPFLGNFCKPFFVSHSFFVSFDKLHGHYYSFSVHTRVGSNRLYSPIAYHQIA